MLLTVVAGVFELRRSYMSYQLSPQAEALIGPMSPIHAESLKYDEASRIYEYNKGYKPGGEVSGQSARPKFSASFNKLPGEGTTVLDPVNETAIKFKPNFELYEPIQNQNRLIYPFKALDAVKVYSLKTVGFKEDIIINSFQGDTLEFTYNLELPNGTEARMESDGSLSVYGVESTLLGNVSTGSKQDEKLLEEARKNGAKNNLLFRFPAPFIIEHGKTQSDTKAWFSLKGSQLTVHASKLKDATYPLSIDPSVYIETAAKLMRGNNETNIDFNVDNELIQKGATTGARFDDWTSSLALNDTRWNGGTAMAGGYVYSVGGMRSSLQTVVYSTVGNDTFVVPAGVISVTVKMWGGGGGGGGGSTNGDGGAGGGAGFSQATLSVTPSESLTVRVGGGGGEGDFSTGTAGALSGDGGGGGGHSEVERSGTSLIIAPGGGGGGGGDNSSGTAGGAGGPGGGSSGTAGGASSSAGGGGGGTTGAGGTAGSGGGNPGSAGAAETGGAGADGRSAAGADGSKNNGGTATGGDGGNGDTDSGFGAGGGGGSGRFGGGGGSGSLTGNAGGGGGGGGSGLTTGTSTTLTSGSGITPGNSSDTQRSSAGEGGAGGVGTNSGVVGTDGRVIITYAVATEDTAAFVGSAGAGAATSVALNIGTPDTNRVVVIMADDESTGTNLTGATVDGKACNLVTRANNSSGSGNHLEMWYCDESDLTTSTGSVTVAITGGDASWAIHAHLYTGMAQTGPTDSGIDNTSVGGSTVTVNGIDVPQNGMAVMGAGNGQSGTWNSWTSPLTERTDGPNPTSAVFGTASGVETSAQTNKTYVATASVGDILRGAGIVASWDNGLVGSGSNEFAPEVYWSRLNTTTGAIESPNPGAGACADWCTDDVYNLPADRAGFSLVAYNGFLYVVGGVDDTGARVNTVYIAKIGANGEPSLWHPTDTNKNNWVYWYSSANTLSSARSYVAATAYNNRLYLLGGQSNATPGGVTTVEYADLKPTGDIGSWSSTGMQALPSFRHGHTVHVYNDKMYLVGGNSNGTLQDTVYYARLNSDGTMNNWVQTSSFTTARSSWGGNYTTVWGGYLYVAGGCSAVNGSGYCTTIASDIQLASINADGSLTEWGSILGITNQRMGYGLVAWRDSIYRVGGCGAQDTSTGDCTGAMAEVDQGVINPAGEVSTVNISVPSGTSPCSGGTPFGCDLPPPGDGAGEAGQLLSMSVILNGYLYVIGGCIDYDCNGTTPAVTGDDITGNTAYVSIDSNGRLTAPASCSGTSYGAWCVDSSNVLYDPTATYNTGTMSQTGTTVTGSGTTWTTGHVGLTLRYNDGTTALITARASNTQVTVNVSKTVGAGSAYGFHTNGVAAAGVTIFNNRIYLVGGLNTTSAGSQRFFYNSTNTDGSLAGAWSNTSFTSAGLTGQEIAYTYAYARANPASAGSNPGNLYIFGGCGDVGTGAGCSSSDYRSEVYKCNIATAGGVASCSTTGQLQIDSELGSETDQGLGIHSGTVYANYIYLIGGFSANVSDRDTVFYAKFNNSNNVVSVATNAAGSDPDDWIESTSNLSVGRRRGFSFGYNGHVYAVGGYDDSGTGIIPFIEWSKMDVSDGSIDPFQTSSVTINQRWGLSMAVSNSYAYVIGGCDVGISPGGCSSFEDSVQTFQLYNNESGAVSDFTAQGDQTFAANTDRIGAASTVYNGYIYVAGGCTNIGCTTVTDNVQFAPLSASDGTVGTWASTTDSTLPAGRAWGGLEVAGGTLYYIGGQTATSTDERPEVYYGTPSSGNVSAWNQVNTSFDLPDGRTQHATASWDNRLYVVGGIAATGGAVSTTVYVSPQLNAGGDITSAWSTSTSFNVARAGAAVTAYANNLYLFGGFDGTNYLNDAQYASIGYKTGTISQSGTTVTGSGTTWTSAMVGRTIQYPDGSTATITAFTSGTSITVNVSKTVTAGTLYVIQDGSVGSWTYTTSLPGALRDASAVSANGYIYLIGGRSAATTCPPNTLITPISANTTINVGNNPTGVGEWYETNVRYTGDRYGAAVGYDNGKLYTMGGGCSAILTANRHYQSTVKSQPQVAKYSRMIDTDTDVFPTKWLMNGIDNSIGARWTLRYRSMNDTDGVATDCGTADMTTWGQETNYGNVTLGSPAVYTPLDGSGTNINCARYYYFSVSIDASKTYGYPEDVNRGPTISDLSLFFTSDPSKRLRHGKTFTGGEQQPYDTPF